MRIYLVGEGRQDIGDLAVAPIHRGREPGFMQPIIERVVGSKVVFEGQKISLLGKKPVRSPREALAKKAWTAAQLACYAEADLLVFVADLDKGNGIGRKAATVDIAKRSKAITAASEEGSNGEMACVPGIACRTIEAWALGDLTAVASLLSSSMSAELPSGKGPEDLWGKPRDPVSDHPKMVLRRIIGRPATQADLSTISERAEIASIRTACPLSFEPFVVGLEAAIGGLEGVT